MKLTMVSYQSYVSGWLDSSIHDFLGVLPRKSAATEYALITCLDSNLNPASLLEKMPGLTRIASECQLCGTGLLLPTRLLLEADSDNQIFFSFDEVWFFPKNEVEPKPRSAWLVGPRRIDQMKIESLGRWMSRNCCSFALGDGEGLNYIIRADGLVKHLLGHSIYDPQPTADVVGPLT